jgi:hypothetical protein
MGSRDPLPRNKVTSAWNWPPPASAKAKKLWIYIFTLHMVVWLVEALCYKPESCKFDS